MMVRDKAEGTHYVNEGPDKYKCVWESMHLGVQAIKKNFKNPWSKTHTYAVDMDRHTNTHTHTRTLTA